ncbi:hypothetical protein WEN_01410 [Mycoplasma wenyonii str. Massachusetts]|uniref:Uncharacterized protein n=1 Tax=Mycoplasma wenyonii (strain Massachusetts) TaxID=1197325 RepID=I6ZEQ3_MYCWM|nr:hypothetical protein [Mycoplasma wenyonii]AFN65077.1 hypothetical protein WEN_01410 [Mycoplasma wenyonii str. Massachusetts]
MAGGGFEKKTEYSFGYIARVKNTNFFKEDKSLSRVKRGLEGEKQEDPEGQLFLVEKVGNKTIIGDSTNNKEQKGLTPKKFLLIGSNRQTKEVEVTGLVSLIQHKHNGINVKCTIKNDESRTIQNGHCDQALFKEYSGEEGNTPPTFIKTGLKSKDGTRDVSIIGLSQEKGTLGIVWGSRLQKKSSNGDSGTAKWSRTGFLYGNKSRGSGSTTKQRIWTSLGNTTTAKGFFVVHDLVFSETGLNREWRRKYEANGTILGSEAKVASCKKTSSQQNGCLKVVDIPLSSGRDYYIWDPSKTQIKNGEFVTDDGIKLPFKLKFDTNWNSLLIK